MIIAEELLAMENIFLNIRAARGRLAAPAVVVSPHLVTTRLRAIIKERGWTSSLLTSERMLKDLIPTLIKKVESDHDGRKLVVFFCLLKTTKDFQSPSSQDYLTHVALLAVQEVEALRERRGFLFFSSSLNLKIFT